MVSNEAGRALQAEQPSLRVLLAEDNLINQLVAAALLKRLGHQVSVANDGAEAVHAIKTASFDVVLMDVQMPTMDGLAATRAIRGLPGDKSRIPIIAMSAGTRAEDAAECLAAGMDGHIGKPLAHEKMFAVLAACRDKAR